MKSYTDLEQSKKLAEFLPLESADMFWDMAEPDKRRKPLVGPISDYFDMEDWAVPAWSLSALLGLMPKLYEFENDPNDGGCQPKLCKGWDNNQWHIVYRSSIYITEWYDDPIDAAFEMICWLKENDKL